MAFTYSLAVREGGDGVVLRLAAPSSSERMQSQVSISELKAKFCDVALREIEQ